MILTLLLLTLGLPLPFPPGITRCTSTPTDEDQGSVNSDFQTQGPELLFSGEPSRIRRPRRSPRSRSLLNLALINLKEHELNRLGREDEVQKRLLPEVDDSGIHTLTSNSFENLQSCSEQASTSKIR